MRIHFPGLHPGLFYRTPAGFLAGMAAARDPEEVRQGRPRVKPWESGAVEDVNPEGTLKGSDRAAQGETLGERSR